ncbi:MAG: cadherin-like beta sandwich domain-containing protein, partial [Oscillospiraceae bacterium]|nr:cadherin-like beta sandwich domain-containing protein [Oscillospiraceae bacterium]
NSVIDKKNHTAQFFVYDTARDQSSIYLNVMQAAVPDENNTKLKTIYTSVIGIDYSQQIRSWESENTALVGLVKQGMEGAVFPLEAQYTDSNGNVQIQSYDITVTRVPTLKSITLDAQGTILPLEFNPVTLSYDVTTVSDKLNIAAEPFGENYIVSGTGDVNISDESCFEITVGYGEQENTYKINVSKASSVPVTLNTPSGVTVQVVNAAGSVISPVDGVYNLIPDESYTYTATKNDVYKSKAAFVASANAVIDVAEPVAEDWLNDFVLYNNFNVSTRLEYKADSGFKPDDHSYIYTVPDTNTTLYAQATSDYSVSAIYSTQTTYVNTHNVSKNIVIDKAVSSGGATNTLTQAIAKSGYANDVTVRVSKTEESITYYQDYEITLAKKLHLVSLSVMSGDEKINFSSDSGATVSFDRDVTEYTVNIDSGLTSINLNGEFPNTSENTDCCGGYYAVINNVSYSDISNLVLPLNTEKYNETIEIVVKHADTNSIETTYTVNVKKTDPVD